MGTTKLYRNIYKKELRENKIFIVTIAFIISFMYNVFNIYYNEILSQISTTKIKIPMFLGGVLEQKIDDFIRGNAFSIAFTAGILILLCGSIYIKEKNKSIACMMYCGLSYLDILKFLIYNTLKSFFIAIIIGYILGVITSPIYNISLYLLLQKSGSLIVFNAESFYLLFLFIVVLMTASIMINIGFVYRNDVLGLMTVDSVKRLSDKRNKKIPWGIILFIYLAPIWTLILLPKMEGLSIVLEVSTYISIFALYFFIRYGIDDMSKYLKKKKFMYKNNRMIYFSNAIKVVKESYIYMLTCLYCTNYALGLVGEYLKEAGVKETLVICIIGISIVIGISMAYKISVEFTHIEKRSFQLKSFGFSNKEIIKIVKSEVVVIFAIVLFTPLIIVIANLCSFLFEGVVTVGFTSGLILGVIISFLLVGFFVAIHFKKKIEIKLNVK